MDRRTSIKQTILLLGGLLSAPTLKALNRFQSLDDTNGLLPLTDAQRQILAEVAEMILPKTETPGAKDAGVPAFVEMMIKDCYQPAEQTSFTDGLASLEKAGFLTQNTSERTATLQKMETEALASRPHKVAPFWMLMKDLTLLGYYSSEVGINASFVYEPIPGKLENIKIKPNQKSYAY